MRPKRKNIIKNIYVYPVHYYFTHLYMHFIMCSFNLSLSLSHFHKHPCTHIHTITHKWFLNNLNIEDFVALFNYKKIYTKVINLSTFTSNILSNLLILSVMQFYLTQYSLQHFSSIINFSLKVCIAKCPTMYMEINGSLKLNVKYSNVWM